MCERPYVQNLSSAHQYLRRLLCEVGRYSESDVYRALAPYRRVSSVPPLEAKKHIGRAEKVLFDRMRRYYGAPSL